jgi:hypothetical protein
MNKQREKEILQSAKQFVSAAKKVKKKDMELIINDYEDKYYTMYIGSILSYNPSGKYYMPWTTNQTDDDIDQDTLFWEYIYEHLPSNTWIESGEGDPLDLYLCKAYGL